MGQEEAVCHTQSDFAQIYPESGGGETRSWISPENRKEEGFVKRPEEEKIESWQKKESVKEVILKQAMIIAFFECITKVFYVDKKDIFRNIGNDDEDGLMTVRQV